MACPGPFQRGQLLLPRLLVKKLAERAEPDDDEDRFQDKINTVVKMVLSRGDMSLNQLHDNLIAISKQPKAPEFSPVKPGKSGDKVVKVFDMAAIRQIKADTSTTRNVKAVMNRFKDADSGERILKKVPARFSKRIQALKAQYPNCTGFLDYVGSFAMLGAKQAYPAFYFPPVLLVGLPGIGKTAVVNAVADSVGVGIRQVDMASTTAGMVLGGMSTQWSDAKAGVVINLLREGGAANPIVILDEIDKASSDAKFDPLGPLYNLLEQGTAAKFIDEALDMPTNASHVLYVATANTLETVPTAILSRFIVLEIHAMSEGQHGAVTQSIYASLLKLHECTGLFNPALPHSVVNALRDKSPREIKATLRRALAQAAMRNPKTKKRLTLLTGDLIFSQAKIFTEKPYDGSNQGFGFAHK